MIRKIADLLSRLPIRALFLLALVLGILVAVLDFLLGFDISLSLFYLAPISIVAWYSGRRAGAVASLLCMLASVASDALVLPPLESSATILVWNGLTRLVIFLVVVGLLTSLHRSLEHERALARTDYLTGLGNPRAFFERASLELDRARRYHRPVSLLYLDLDDFKRINDRHGHAVGDEALRMVGSAMERNLRGVDVVGRLGGDEFAVLLPETGVEGARSVAAKVRKAMREVASRKDWALTFSMGILTCEVAPEDAQGLIAEVDSLMYAVKKSGKNGSLHEVLAQDGKVHEL